MNNRRKLVLALGASALASPLSLRAQPTRVWRVGFLGAATAQGYVRQIEALRAGFRDLGYVEGKNIIIEYRWAEGDYTRLPGIADEFVKMGVDVIVTHGTPGALAAKQATTTIPIVMATIGEAVSVGIVTSLARPGGNITGTTFFVPELTAKRLEIIRDAMPRAQRVALLFNSGNPATTRYLKAVATTAQALKLDLHQFPTRKPEEFEGAFAAMAVKRLNALVVNDDGMMIANARTIAELAAKRRLPSIGFPEFADAGGMLGFGVSTIDMFRRAPYFVDKIFKGAKPNDIPVEQWNRFEIIVNLKVAKALGIKLPDIVLQRADRVIE